MLVRLLILPVRLYQMLLSPLLPVTCRHEPSCSHYTIQALKTWGAVKGLWLATKRVVRCNPWGTHGYDPVPEKYPKPTQNAEQTTTEPPK